MLNWNDARMLFVRLIMINSSEYFISNVCVCVSGKRPDVITVGSRYNAVVGGHVLTDCVIANPR